ncbi:MAG: hypothetical protein QG603_713 [Patescibacteria group bacterium]|nr:hypothetical protein [Patescibacteria group bacterium]
MNKMIKFYYIANYRFPSERAHSIQVAENCQAFADLGYELVLLVPQRRTSIQKDFFEFYGLKKNFSIRKIFCLDLLDKFPNRFTFWLQNITFNLSILFTLRHQKYSIIYSRDFLNVIFLALLGRELVFEVHNISAHVGFLRNKLFNKVRYVVISHGLKEALIKIGIDSNKILVAPDGVNTDKFLINSTVEKNDLKKKFHWPLDQKIILYTGQLYEWKGVDVLLAAASSLLGYQVCIVGGSVDQIDQLKKKFQADNIFFMGQQAYSDLPLFLQAADCLVLPNSSKEKISKYYTSPMKLFEYLSSGAPIVAADLPSIREIVSEKEVYFFEADNFQSLAQSVESVFVDPVVTKIKTLASKKKAEEFSWKHRVDKISKFLHNEKSF